MTFRYIDDSDRKQIGFIAQEVNNVFPEVVNKPGKAFYSISNFELDTIIIKAVQNYKYKKDKEIEKLKKSFKEEILELEKKIKIMQKDEL